STSDKPTVEELGRRLRQKEGIESWLDKWNLIPGVSWQPAIEEALKECESCAVFLGPEGLGPWQREEMSVAINRRVCDSEQRFRVIPVLLPGAKRESLSAFLLNTTWSDSAAQSTIRMPSTVWSVGFAVSCRGLENRMFEVVH